MIISKRKYYRRLYITMLLVGVLISVSILTANKLLFHMNMIDTASKYLFLLTLTVIVLWLTIVLVKPAFIFVSIFRV